MAFRIQAQAQGTQKFARFLEASVERAEEGMAEYVKAKTLEVHAEAVRGIQQISAGHKETRYKPKRSVTVSKPGDPPNTDTGRLIGSIKFGFENLGMTGFVGSALRYAKWLEFGTKEMAARPWLRPALQAVRRMSQGIKLKVFE